MQAGCEDVDGTIFTEAPEADLLVLEGLEGPGRSDKGLLFGLQPFKLLLFVLVVI